MKTSLQRNRDRELHSMSKEKWMLVQIMQNSISNKEAF